MAVSRSRCWARPLCAGGCYHEANTRYGETTLVEYLDRYNLKSSRDIVQFFDELLLAVPLADEVRSQLVQRLDVAGPNRPRELKQVLHLLGSQPEFQLA